MNPSRSRLVKLVSIVAALTLIAAACGGGDEEAGDVVVTGSSTVEPISARNAEKFNEANPNVAISVDGPGTGDGFEIFCDGGADISDASRAIKEEEATTCADNGIEFIELKVGIDGLSVVTSKDNDTVECLSFLDLYALLGPESQGFGKWSDADDLAGELDDDLAGEFGESHAPYPDEDLVVTAPGEESGTYDSFVEIVLGKIAEAREADEATRPDYQASPNDNVIIEGVGGGPSSLGWVGYSFVAENPEAVKAVPVDGGDGCVEPTADTIAAGEYPVARPLFIYVNKARAQENEGVAAYVDFYMSEDGFASVTEKDYIALTAEEIEATRGVWEAKETGTREG